MLDVYERSVRLALRRAGLTVAALMATFVLSLAIYPLLGVAFFPRTDAGQFTINLKAPTGTRIELTNEYVAKVEDLIKKTIAPEDFRMTVSNIGVVPDFSALYTTNTGAYTATIQTQLTDDHKAEQLRLHGSRCSAARQGVSRAANLLSERLDGGRDHQHRYARSDRHSGQQPRHSGRFPAGPRNRRQSVARFPKQVRSTFRRIWIIPASAWMWIACTPPNSA